jgi:hypothetical protein
MAQIVIDIPADQVPRVITAFKAAFDYGTNGAGLTDTQFVKKVVAQWIREITMNQERAAAIAGLPTPPIDVS